ncbi:hypothetical protein HRF89_01635 [Enterococcus faecalis]|nr:hypothetical protein [Enterococcus faecalis]
MHELIKEIERQLEMDRIEEGNMSAEDVLYIVKGFKRPYLNENQQIVLDWLECYTEREAVTPIDAVARFWRERNELGQPSSWRLNGKQQAQVLQAFSQWAIEQEGK